MFRNSPLLTALWDVLCVREEGVADGRANHRNKPTVGDRPRAPSPPLPPRHMQDVLVHHKQDDDNDIDDIDDEDTAADDDDDWDEVRSVCFCVY